MFALETSLAPEPLRLAQQLWGEEGAALLWSADGSGPSYLACWPTDSSSALDPEPELELAARVSPDRRVQVPRWLGLLPYEAERRRWERSGYRQPELRARPHHTAPLWWRYRAVIVIGRRVTVVGDSEAMVRRLHHRLTRAGPSAQAGQVRVTPREVGSALTQHAARIAQAIRHIVAGDVYQINVAHRLTFGVEGCLLALARGMGQQAKAPYCCALKDAGVVSTSPELFLSVSPGGRVHTIPIKGTRPRGESCLGDIALRKELETSEKEAAELTMVVDVERSDLAWVSRLGSVSVSSPKVVSHPSIFHRQAEVSAVLGPDITRSQLLRATLPSGSITGAPKVRAMELIAQLEQDRRGLYTGAIGFLDHAGGLRLSMAIRTLTVQSGLGHYFVGGGIVADSDVALEVEETQWKAVQISGLVSST